MGTFQIKQIDGHEVTYYPQGYKKKHDVLTILAPGKARTDDFYLSGRVWRCLQTKRRLPALLNAQLKQIHASMTEVAQ
jgi:hypothetical protein